RRRALWPDRGNGSFSDSASPANENQGGGSPPRPSSALRSAFGKRHAALGASASYRWSRRSRRIYGAGSRISATVQRLRCCNVLNTGYAAGFAGWGGSNGSVVARGFVSFANGVSVRLWPRQRPVVLTAPGGSRTLPL